MRRKLLPLFSSLLLITFISPTISTGITDNLDKNLEQVRKQIQEKKEAQSVTQKKLQEAQDEEKKYRGSLTYYQYQHATTQQKLSAVLDEIRKKEATLQQTLNEISQKQTQLERQKELLHKGVRSLYIENRAQNVGALILLKDVSLLTKTLIYRNSVIKEYRQQILNYQTQIQKLQQDKEKLENLKAKLQTEKEQLQTQRDQLTSTINQTRKKIQAAQSEQQRLQQELIGLDQSLNDLTQKEREILAAKAAAALARTTVGDEEISRAAIEKAPPKDGKTYFSFWTYGYPHRVGMSQYGAYGRAKSGQNAETILKAYYTGVQIVDYETPATIQIIQNSQTLTLKFEEEYLMGIGEMPSCWGSPQNGGLEALKAQAIVARTYALYLTNNGSQPICTDQRCQVYVGPSKIKGMCGEYWKQAVEETKGKVIVSHGKPIAAWYHSSAGGFTLSSAQVWGGERSYAQGIADLDPQGQAYDGPHHGNSPWYHKAWGNEPWLSVEEVTQIFNAALEREGQSIHVQHLQTLAVSGADGPETQEVIAYYGSPGQLQEAKVSAKTFRLVFNLKSPGTDALWTTRFDLRVSQ